jgi:hypothetical protein
VLPDERGHLGGANLERHRVQLPRAGQRHRDPLDAQPAI